MEYKLTLYEKEDGIAKSTMNRPEKMNAVLRPMIYELEDQLQDFRDDKDAKVWVITGAGRGFCAGDDLDELKKLHGEASGEIRMPRRAARVPRLLQTIDKPTIAMVNGAAVGMGFEIALACDFIIASEKAKFGEVYIQRGTIASSGPWVLPRKVGLKNAIEICLLGELFGADQAQEYGLTYKITSAEELEATTFEFAKKLAGLPSIAYQFTKHALLHGLDWDLDAELDYVAYAREIASKAGEAAKAITEFQKTMQSR
ncbi:enoyl-CoA hydratase/isomerase family protein [Chloroflexota bacterium]